MGTKGTNALEQYSIFCALKTQKHPCMWKHPVSPRKEIQTDTISKKDYTQQMSYGVHQIVTVYFLGCGNMTNE